MMFGRHAPAGMVLKQKPLYDRFMAILEKYGYVCVSGKPSSALCTALEGPGLDRVELGGGFTFDGWDTNSIIDQRLADANYQSMTFIEFIGLD